jgi:peptidase E
VFLAIGDKMATAPPTILNELLDSLTHCFTPAVAQDVANLQYESHIQQKLEDLRQKANEGTLSPTERKEYESFVDAVDLISILKVKSRQLLQERASE